MKKSYLLILCVLFNTILISGCVSNGVYTSGGVKISDVQTAFIKGDIRFNCDQLCAGNFGYHRPEMKKLLSAEKWNDLMLDLTNIGFSVDLAYYYLGRSAEGLNYFEAAMIYYNLAHEVRKCDRIINNCDGFKFPQDLLDRENIIKVSLARTKTRVDQKNLKLGNNYPVRTSNTEVEVEATSPVIELDRELKPNSVTGKLE